MTPTTAAEKVKEICKAIIKVWSNCPNEDDLDTIVSAWLKSPQGSRLVGELGEDRLERAINWLEVQSTNEIIDLDYRQAYAMTYEVLKKHFKIN